MNNLKSAALITQIGLDVTSGIIVGYIIGYYLDKWLNTNDWLTFIFMIFGVISGGRTAYYRIKHSMKNNNNNNDDNKRA